MNRIWSVPFLESDLTEKGLIKIMRKLRRKFKNDRPIYKFRTAYDVVRGYQLFRIDAIPVHYTAVLNHHIRNLDVVYDPD